MISSKKLFRFSGIFMIAALICVLLFYAYVRKNAESYNDTLRSDKEDDSLSLSIYPRGGDTDSWTKGLADGSSLTGSIFEMKAVNRADCEISDWSEKIFINQDCYLNNGWCGTFEVHQFSGDTETVQTVDLRNYVLDDITLEYLHEGQDLLIALHSGDYIVYHPSAAVYEIPLSVSAETTVGFILYYSGDSVDFSLSEASFYLNRSYHETKEYNIFLFASYIWGILAIVYVSLFIFSLFTEKELKKRERNLEESIATFSGFVDAKDTYTNGHSKRVALYAQKIAKAMGYSEQKAREVYYIGLMHDCGKCYIPDSILKKPGTLTKEEFDIIKTHTTRGADILENFGSIENIREGALSHHERYDGKGYPEGKSGTGIPEVARILCIADSFDAMNSKRVYRGALSPAQIRSELENGSGTQFDPNILTVFLKLLDEGEIHFIETAKEKN